MALKSDIAKVKHLRKIADEHLLRLNAIEDQVCDLLNVRRENKHVRDYVVGLLSFERMMSALGKR